MKVFMLKMAALGIAALGLSPFSSVRNGSIKGTISPLRSATEAMAVSGMDTVKAMVDHGSFNIRDLKPGAYKLVIEAVPPFKNREREGVIVLEGKPAGVGEINLQH